MIVEGNLECMNTVTCYTIDKPNESFQTVITRRTQDGDVWSVAVVDWTPLRRRTVALYIS